MAEFEFCPVFVLGFPRSGTTLLASRLGAGESVLVLPEMNFCRDLLDLQIPDIRAARVVVDQLRRNFRFRALDIEPNTGPFVEALMDADKRERIWFILRTYAEQHSLVPKLRNRVLWVEHSPGNVRSVRLFMSLFPDSKYIHICRDPRGVYSSMSRLEDWNTPHPLEFSRRWLSIVSTAHRQSVTNPDRVTEINYESLLSNPELELQRICAFVSCSYAESMIDSGGIHIGSYSRMQHALVHGRLSQDRANAWKESLRPRDAEVIHAVCMEWMAFYEYVSLEAPPRYPSRQEVRRYQIRALARAPMAKIKRVIRNLKVR